MGEAKYRSSRKRRLSEVAEVVLFALYTFAEGGWVGLHLLPIKYNHFRAAEMFRFSSLFSLLSSLKKGAE